MNRLYQLILYTQCLSLIVGTSALFGLGTDFALEYEFPFVVSLTNAKGGLRFCGGTLISRKHILTASDCLLSWNEIPKHPADFKVRLGSNALTKCEQYKVEYFKTFKECARKEDIDDRLYHNIAVVTLKEAVPDHIKPAELFTLNEDDLKNKKLVTTGWDIAPVGRNSDILRFGVVTVIDKETAKQNYGVMSEPSFTPEMREHMHTNHVCTVGIDPVYLGTSDRGAPLIYDKNKVVGVNTYSSRRNLYEVLHNNHQNINFDPYRRFIEHCMNETSPPRRSDDGAGPNNTSAGSLSTSPRSPRRSSSHGRKHCSEPRCTIL